MEIVAIILGIIIILALIACFIFYLTKHKRKPAEKSEITINKESIETLAEYVKAQKEQAEAVQQLKDLKKAEIKQKLEVFKQTKDQLKEKLKTQIDQKAWVSLNSILESADKGGTGIYIIHNETKNKYYVGQAKQLVKRVKDHFYVETMTLDFLAGDKMNVKFLTANELDADYRLDHIEKTGIEIFNAGKSGYNKTTGNL